MIHYASSRFWSCYDALPSRVQRVADKAYEYMKDDPSHPSVKLKKVGKFWSVRVGLLHRALAIEHKDGFLWFWIGTHAEYDKLLTP